MIRAVPFVDPVHVAGLVFAFLFGACAGSFLNVVALRLPEVEVPDDLPWWRVLRLQARSLSYPPSRCPRCGAKLRIYDNVPIVGWLLLRGRCRNCHEPISARYPLVELLSGVLFVAIYASFSVLGPAWGPPTPAIEPGDPLVRTLIVEGRPMQYVEPPADPPPGIDLPRYRRAGAEPGLDWAMLGIVLVLACCLLAASLVDAVHYVIPRVLSYLPAIVGVAGHAAFDTPGGPMSLVADPVGCAWALGGGLGLVLSLLLLGSGFLRRSFADGLPPLERDAGGDYVPLPEGVVRREMLRELAFLAPPVLLGLAAALLAGGPLSGFFAGVADLRPAASACGALLGGLVGAGAIWATRVLGSLAFGREAMGLGDVDLMFGVGCCLGGVIAGLALFPAAILGLAFAVAKLVTRSGREMPFGPFLATGSLVLFFGANWLADASRVSVEGLAILLGPASPIVGL